MNLSELNAALAAAQPDAHVRLTLPEGGRVPDHFHVTEVGHVQKDFIDCGGQRRAVRTCLLQTWLAHGRDDGHRLTAERFRRILAITAPLFADEALPVEIEYEDGVVSQFPLKGVMVNAGGIWLQLDTKKTDCRAREMCGADDGGEGCGGADPARKTAGCF